MYKDINQFSGHVYRAEVFLDSQPGYIIQYYCEAEPGAKLSEKKRRIQRYRYSTSNNVLKDVKWAINDFDESRYDYGRGTSDFIFGPITESYVKSLSYDYVND